MRSGGTARRSNVISVGTDVNLVAVSNVAGES